MKDINRREFLGGIGIGTAGTLGSKLMMPNRESVKNKKILRFSKLEENINPGDVKINVKPVHSYMIHDGVWEGPCRWNPNPPPEKERAMFRSSFDKSIERLKSSLTQDVKLLDSVYIEYREGYQFGFGERELRELDADKEEVDLYLASGNVYPQYPACLIGERYKKPVAMTGSLVNNDMSALLRSKGLEGYAPYRMDDLNKLISILRARKVFQNTNMLFITNTRGKINRPTMSFVSNFEDLNNRFGINAKVINYKDLSNERDRVMQSRDIMREVENFVDRLIKNAQGTYIDRKYVISNVEFTFAVKNLMKKYNCNVATIECFEFCSSRLSSDWRVVPCAHNSILKDEGYPSACEGDISALLTMDMLMSLSQKSSFMGNLRPVDDNSVEIHHNVPGRKMNGFDKPDLPYQLRNFVKSGWGAKFEIDYSKNEEKTVTFARLNPLADKILLAKGEVIGCKGFGVYGCTLRAIMSMPDARGLLDKRANYGFHYAAVFGDYTKEVIELADMLNMEVETHNL